MIKLKKNLAVPLLLAFLAFTFNHLAYSLPHSQANFKAVINVDDGASKGQWDNEKKLPLVIQIHFVLTFILLAAAVPLIYLSIILKKSHIFLIPIFHQSNYVIHSPEL
ncbi:hypothetical protein [Neobacillus sp. OS1-33]|jgi:hypothetical protein|uniref:hypothetical protein n=1 Tax=Neobacillus sp. OS1-33 TaxID=3070683 RepID=UPI0027DEDF7B|nr:hypothetical protein [Neobacillus sp. OS1-33]WML24022.1 hypothetical protein RCG22_13695 [Neobacillus sp. OS1-33]